VLPKNPRKIPNYNPMIYQALVLHRLRLLILIISKRSYWSRLWLRQKEKRRRRLLLLKRRRRLSSWTSWKSKRGWKIRFSSSKQRWRRWTSRRYSLSPSNSFRSILSLGNSKTSIWIFKWLKVKQTLRAMPNLQTSATWRVRYQRSQPQVSYHRTNCQMKVLCKTYKFKPYF